MIDIYSKRQKRRAGEPPDPYKYDVIPGPLRVQIIQILRDIAPRAYNEAIQDYPFEIVRDVLRREYGVFQLVDGARTDRDEIERFINSEPAADRVLDGVELSFRVMENLSVKHKDSGDFERARVVVEDGIKELNHRLKEHGIGFQFVEGEIFRIDSEYIHAEAVLPALVLLSGPRFEGANAEFLNAHEHYRHGRLKECMVECLKAFESTMRAVCEAKSWDAKQPATSKNLIAACLANGLLPQFEEAQMSALRTLLESGVPTLRNKLGGHGQGTAVVGAPEYLTRYALNLTASAILVIGEAAKI